MSILPVIIGFGGINSAGRSSAHHGYRRLVLDQLSYTDAQQTRASLASLMGLLKYHKGVWLDLNGTSLDLDSALIALDPVLQAGTLIRKLENNLFDPGRMLFHKRASLHADAGEAISFIVKRQHLPDAIPLSWQLSNADHGMIRIEIRDSFDILTENYRASAVNSAGQLPSGFDPLTCYASRSHPRGLQLTVVGASDAVQSMGIDWAEILKHVAPDQISVYAGSSMSQLDYDGNAGLMQARLLGRKVTSKQLALGFAEMPADFINAYILGNIGTTGTNVAACATFLYNLRQGLRDIRSGSHRLSIIGTSEAPLTPEVIDGYATMGALIDDEALLFLDKNKGLSTPDHRRACRPFGINAGFTLAESAQFIVLCEDSLAMSLGASIYGAINEVFVNADGFKKSIASPGVGNYITMAKAAAATRNVIGAEGLQKRSYVQAHGTGTPQNRITESHILSEIAKTWQIKNWPVTALKSYIGHSLASSSADQLVSSLGVWKYGIIPGILSTEQIADDVHQENLEFLLQHKQVGAAGMDAVLLNSKGFGGNNATASILAPHIASRMLEKKHGKAALKNWQQRNESVMEKSAAYDQATIEGRTTAIYKFDNNVLDGTDLQIDQQQMRVAGHLNPINLQVENSYSDMCD